MNRSRVVIPTILLLSSVYACIGDDPAGEGPSSTDDGGGSADGNAPPADADAVTDSATDAPDAAPNPGTVSAALRIGGVGDTLYPTLARTQGGYFLAFSFKGEAKVGAAVLSSAGERDIGIARLDENLDVLWARSIGGAGVEDVPEVAATSTGELALTFWGKGGALTIAGQSFTSVENYAVYTVGIRGNDGVALWATRVQGDYEMKSQAIAFDGAGHVVVSGVGAFVAYEGGSNFAGAGGYDALLASFGSTNGARQWLTFSGGANNDSVPALAARSGASLIAAASYEGTSTFEGTTLTSKGAADTALRFISTAGVAVTAPVVLADGSGEEYVTNLAASADAIAAVGNYKNGKARVGGLELPAPATSGATNAFVALLNAAGSPKWVRGMVGARLDSVALLADGSVIGTGASTAGASVDGKPIPNVGGEDIFVGHWSSDGTLLWFHSVGSPLDDGAASAVQAADGSVLVVCDYRGTIDLAGPITADGARDIVIARYVP